MTENSNKKVVFKQVRLERKYPENLQTHFVTNIVVQHQTDFFTLSFFEAYSPPILGSTPEEQKSTLEALDHVDAKCVSRIIVTPDQMREFAKAINENFANYETMMKLRTKK